MSTATKSYRAVMRSSDLAMKIDALLTDHVDQGHPVRETATALSIMTAQFVIRANQQGFGTISDLKATACGDVARAVDVLAEANKPKLPTVSTVGHA